MKLYRIRWLRWLVELYWRLREQDVLDVGTPDDRARDARGAVLQAGPGHRPDAGPDRHDGDDGDRPTSAVATAPLAWPSWTAKKGLGPKMAATAHPIRSQGGRPHDNGSRAVELRDGASRAHGVKLRALAVDEIPGVLRQGFAVVVNLDYADLPDWLKTQGGSFGHSCTLYGWQEDGDLVGFFDPLWGQGARGAWATWGEVRPALWADGEHSGTTTRWGEAPGPAPGPDPEPPPPEPCDELTPEQLAQLELDAVRAGRARARPRLAVRVRRATAAGRRQLGGREGAEAVDTLVDVRTLGPGARQRHLERARCSMGRRAALGLM